MMVLALLFVVLLTVGATVGLTYTLLIKTKETAISSSGTMIADIHDADTAEIAMRIDAAVKYTVNTTDPATNATLDPHVLLKTSLGDIWAFADGTYNGPAFQTIARQIPSVNGRRLLIRGGPEGQGTGSGSFPPPTS